jgi:hypothetical protein
MENLLPKMWSSVGRSSHLILSAGGKGNPPSYFKGNALDVSVISTDQKPLQML